jgi:RNA polymerase sigma-70 factor (ECF subfamily)
LNALRRIDIHSRFVRKTLEAADETVNQTECLIMDHDYARLLNEAIETLSPKQKDVFQLSRVQGLSYKEIAELMQISPNMVQEHASIALHKIKKYLTQHADIHFAVMLLCLL